METMKALKQKIERNDATNNLRAASNKRRQWETKTVMSGSRSERW